MNAQHLIEKLRPAALKHKYQHDEGFFDGVEPLLIDTAKLSEEANALLDDWAAQLEKETGVSYLIAMNTIINHLLEEHAAETIATFKHNMRN